MNKHEILLALVTQARGMVSASVSELTDAVESIELAIGAAQTSHKALGNQAVGALLPLETLAADLLAILAAARAINGQAVHS